MSQRYIGGLIYNPPGGFSGQFNGSSSYLSAPDSSSWYFTGDFTVECWAYWNNTSSSEANVLAQHRPASAANQAIEFWSNTTTLYFAYSSSNVTTTITAGQWYHLAMSCTSGTASCYLNGVRIGTFSMPTRIDSADPFTIGARTGSGGSGATGYFPGYISNVRVINGTGIYSGSSITVPNGALQNVTNTKLLTCQSATFIDNSSSPFTITNNSASVSAQNPFPLNQLPNPALGNAGNGVYNMSQYRSLLGSNQWPAVDPYFDYTTLMLHGNGTNGAQNNTFLDSSTNNFTITRNGNTTQGTFTPYGSNWSNYFDGSSNLSYTDSSQLNFGTGSYTIEFWINGPSNNDKFILGNNNTSTIQVTTGGSSSTAGSLRYVAGGNVTTSGSVLITDNAWHHCAIVRNGSSNVTLYVDGVSVGTLTDSTNYTSTTSTVTIAKHNSLSANYLTGYLSNLRIIKGTALYTANFTPPASPLTAISGTSLLTCQSNRFIDNSSNAFALTVTGSPSVQRFSPFAPTAPYSTSVVGGSGYFDGSGDYLTAPDNSAWDVGSGNFTIESWVYPTSSVAQPIIVGQWTSSYAWVLLLSNDSNRYLRGILYDGSFRDYGSSTSLQLNAWNHCAFVRESNTVSLYLNGARVYTTTYSGTVSTSTSAVSIGADSSGASPFAGYLSQTRVVVGTALYSGTTYTVPTSPLTAVTNTSLLLNFTNGGIIDNAMMNDLETVGNAQISTSVSKFGGGSMAFDGSGDALALPANINLAVGGGDFTIEMWVNGANNGSAVGGSFPRLFTLGTAQGAGCIESYNASGTMYVDISAAGGPISFTASTLLNSTWNHYAISRAGTSLRAFVNGTQVGTTATNSTNINLAATTQSWIGAISASAGNFNGYIDDLRITKFARYTANFTPPTSQLQDQ